MLRVRTVDNIDDFVGAPDDPDDYRDLVGGMWESGASRPEWCFVAEDGPTRVGRIGFRTSPTVSNPAWAGSLPSDELFAYGLELPWDGDFVGPGKRLIAEAAAAISGTVPDLLQVGVNNDFHQRTAERGRFLTAAGMTLFQEKHGFTWDDDGRYLETSGLLGFRTVNDIGLDAYRAVMAPCGAGTLDRNDLYYWTGCGPENWASQMTEFLDEEDADMWLVGFRDDDPVGYIAVSSDEDWGATIAHVGVLPRHRGNGYIRELLVAANRATRDHGIRTMLSDVDTLNQPMKAAMARTGHVENPDRWHLWTFRADLASLTTA